MAPSSRSAALALLLAVLVGVVVPGVAAKTRPRSTGPINNRPIIGVLNEPTDSDYASYGSAYFDAAYVKWLESAGARVAPVPYNATEEEWTSLFYGLNGILFTGGGLDLEPDTQYYKAGQFFYQMSLNAFKNGDYFPIWGTCQGFQFLSILTANDTSVLEINAFDSENLQLALNFTAAAATSRMFANAPASVMETLGKTNSTQNLHVDCVTPDTYATNSRLNSFFNVLSTNVDRVGNPFVSTVEAKEAPIFAVQWHPERTSFSWDTEETLPHTADAVAATQYMANFFVSQARMNFHSFASPAAEAAALIYNYKPTYTGNDSDSYPDMQTYFF